MTDLTAIEHSQLQLVGTCQRQFCHFVQTSQFNHSAEDDSLIKGDDFSNFFAKTNLMLDDYQEYWRMPGLRLGGSWQVWENRGGKDLTRTQAF